MKRRTDLPGRRVTPRSRHAWRRWLADNHRKTSEVWVTFYKSDARRRGRPTLTYGQAVEQAICFGWIDGLKRRVDGERYAHRFTPRKPNSNWSETNRARLQRMRSLGLMTPAGEAAVAAAIRSGAWARSGRPPRVETPPEFLTAVEADREAFTGWKTLPPSEQQRYGIWIGVAKREETRRRRLAESIEKLRRGERLGMK